MPGARWLAIKALPLALLVPGVAQGKRRARQWLALATPLYFGESLARALSENGRSGIVAAVACTMAGVTFVATLMWFRAEREARRR